jgi:hypothetical protein
VTSRVTGQPGGNEEIVDGGVTWRFDRRFLTSNWTCIWGRGCKGILDEPAEHLNQNCCSIGAEMADPEEAMTVSALAATLEQDLFQCHRAIDADDVFSDSTRTNTKVVDGACIFFNRPGFAGGEGCALHLAALRAGESPIDWKPSVCWQLPIKVDWEQVDDGTEIATVRGWQRGDWGDDGDTMHWCCTEGPEAYVGGRTVVESLADELSAVVGNEVYVELRRRLR